MKHTHYIRQSYLFCRYRNHVLDIGHYLAGKKVLELGPNKGYLFEKFYVKLQKKHRNLHYKISGFEDYAGVEKFDAIVMMAVISHIPMTSEAIVEKIDALLNPGGHLVVETNNSKRNLGVFDLCEKRYEKVVAKPSYGGLMRKLKIDYRDVLIYRKPATEVPLALAA